MKRPPKDTTVSGEIKAGHMLKRLKDRPRKAVPLADFYRSHDPAPPVHTADPNLPTSTTMSTERRDYQMKPERRYEPSPASGVQLKTADFRAAEDRTKPNPDWVPCVPVPADQEAKVKAFVEAVVRREKSPLEVTAEVLRALANDLRTTEPQVAEWADYLAQRIGG